MNMQINKEHTVEVIHKDIEAHKQAEEARPRPRTTKKVLAFFAAGAIGAAALTAVGLAPRAAQQAELVVTANAVSDARRVVTVARPTRDGAVYELRLPGSTAAVQAAVLHARTNGYLKSFAADIGDRVTAGQVLAEIESPEVDEQLNEARAVLKQREADLELARFELERIKALHAREVASLTELEERIREHNAATAAVEVAQAVVSRLEKEQGYQKVVAPFDGVVTQRNVELGSLVTAGSSAGITPLFRIEQNSVLKVFIDVPQTAAPSVAVGQSVAVEIREFPGRKFEGKVVRTAGAVDPATRTLRTEVHLANEKGELLSGVYAQVHLGVTDPRRPVRVPSAALVIGAAGPQVVLVDEKDELKRQAVTLGRDFGKEVEVTGGLIGEERVVLNPRDDLRDGAQVSVR